MSASPEFPGGRPSLGAYDLHVHTTMSDGDLRLDEVVAIAAAAGVRVGIADHVSARNPSQFLSSLDRVERYLDALDAAPVFRSGELCWCDPFGAALPGPLLDRFDYLIGSNHGFALPDGTLASPWWETLPDPWNERPQELMEILVLNLCDLVAAMPISIVAHSTMIPPALLALEPDVRVWWTDDREDTFIDAAVRAGVAIEISNRYRLPHARFLEKARQAGARFTLGSDGHQRSHIARLDWAVDAAIAAGVREGDLFVPEERKPRDRSRRSA